MEASNLEVRDLQQKYENLSGKYTELLSITSRIQGEVAEIKRVSTSFAQQTNWQLLGFSVVMASVMMGGIYYQTNALRNEFNPKLEALQKQMDLRFEAQQQQLQQLQKNLDARFEDLKQEVRASKK